METTETGFRIVNSENLENPEKIRGKPLTFSLYFSSSM